MWPLVLYGSWFTSCLIDQARCFFTRLLYLSSTLPVSYLRYDTNPAGCSVDRDCGGASGADGRCDTKTALCQCLPGYSGADCSHDSCMGTVKLDTSGTIVHGARATARNNALCRWVLTAPEGKVVSLTLHSLELDTGFDEINVYALDGGSSEGGSGGGGGAMTMGAGAGADIPSAPPLVTLRGRTVNTTGAAAAAGKVDGVFKTTSRKCVLVFTSDSAVESKGFNITFSSEDGARDCGETSESTTSSTTTGATPLDDTAVATSSTYPSTRFSSVLSGCSSTGTCRKGKCVCDLGWFGKLCRSNQCVVDSGLVTASRAKIRSNAPPTRYVKRGDGEAGSTGDY